MKNNQLICHECHRVMESTKGALYNPNIKAHTCKDCVKKSVNTISDYQLTPRERVKVNLPIVAAVLLMMFSVLFFFSGNTLLFLLSFVMFPMSIVLFVVYGKLWYRVRHEKVLSRQTERYNIQQAKIDAELEAKKPYNFPWDCPYCGAHTIGKRCEYCDSPYAQ